MEMSSIMIEDKLVSDGIHVIFLIKSVVFNDGQCVPPRGHLAMLGDIVGYNSGGELPLASR